MKKIMDIYSIVDALEKCKETVDSELKLLSTKSLSDRELEFNHSFEILERILKIIGKGLYAAAREATKNDDLIFYFWPGYTTLKQKRVLIKGILNTPNLGIENYFTGVGFDGSLDNIFFDCPSTLYFDAVLKSANNFTPPTTHNWKRQQPDDLKIKLNDKSNLKILLIEKSAETKVISNMQQILHLTFNENEIANSSEEIAKLLSVDGNSISLEPVEKTSTFIPWPFNKLYKSEDLDIIHEDNLFTAQKLVYPVWFAATFCDTLYNYDKKYGEENWLNKVKAELKHLGFNDLTQRIIDYQFLEAEHSKNKNFHEIHFDYWYSLFFDNYDTTQELGSAMFLTNSELPKEFLYHALPWIEFMYGQLRNMDYATLTESKTKKEEWESIFKELNHNTKTYFSYSLRQLKKLSESNVNVAPIYENLRELKAIFNLTEYIFSIDDYLKNSLPEEINLKNLIEKIIEILIIEIEFNDGGNLKLKEKGDYLLALKNGITSIEAPLFRFHYSATQAIISYPIVLHPILTNIISNATRDAVSLEEFKKNNEKPEVTILAKDVTIDDKRFIHIQIQNKAKMPDEIREAYEKDLFDENFAHHNKLGLKITKKYLKALSYPVEIATEKNFSSFSLFIPLNHNYNESNSR